MGRVSIGLVSGGFDPIHSGHVDMIQHVARRNSSLIVAVNSDEWLVNKKGTYFMPYEERSAIVKGLAGVTDAIAFNDADGSANDAIAQVKKIYPDCLVKFYNGGDRTANNILEILKYEGDPDVEFHFSAGGDYKKNSSSDILRDWIGRHHQITERSWGSYSVLQEMKYSKLKTLKVAPGESLSMQKHEHRAEHWFVAWGTATVQIGSGKYGMIKELERHGQININKGAWHKLSNNTNKDLYMVEIQYGEKCEESDIIRESR